MSPPFPSWRPKFASWLPPRTFPKTFAPQSWRFCTNWIRSNRSSTWPQMTMSKCRCIIPKLRRFIVVLPPMMKTIKPSPRRIRLSRLIVKSGVAILLCGVTVTAQSRIIRPQTQPTASASARRQHTATLRASDSPDGSRVSLSSDQSLNNYEAYRRGDRFYVRIPAADVPRAEATRGRGFADVKAQRTGDSTVISFRLQPGATAHVEQHSNRLDVVFTLPGGNTGATTGRDTTLPRSTPDSTVDRKANANKPNSSNSSSASKKANTSVNRNANLAPRGSAVPSNANSAGKTPSPVASTTSAGSKPGATPTATAKPT